MSLANMEDDYTSAFQLSWTQATEAVEACEKHEENLTGLLLEGIIGAPRVDEARVKTAQARLELDTRVNEQRQLGKRLEAARAGRFTSRRSGQRTTSVIRARAWIGESEAGCSCSTSGRPATYHSLSERSILGNSE